MYDAPGMIDNYFPDDYLYGYPDEGKIHLLFIKRRE